MFLKLIKHEMRASGRLMLPILAALPVVAALSALSSTVGDGTESVIVAVVSTLTTIAFSVCCIAVLVMAFVVMIVRFRNSMLTDEGYLTNTLPVSTHSLVCSRLVTAMIYYVLAMLALVLSVSVFAVLTDGYTGVISDMPDTFSDVFEFYGFDDGEIDLRRIVLQALWISALSLAATCLHFYAAMSLGHAAADHKGLLSVVYYLVLGAVLRTVVSTISVSSMLKLEDGIGGMEPGAAITQWFSSQMFISAMVYLVFGAACYVITVLMLKKKLNLA